MKKIVLSVLALTLFLSLSCARSGDTLVTYSGGKISRGEFYSWLSANRYEPKTVTKSKSMQKSKLLSFAVEKIASEEASKTGFTATADIMLLTDISRKQIIAQDFLDKNIFPDSSATEPVVLIDSLLFRSKGQKNMGNTPDKLSLACKDLAAGVSFADVSRRYSDGIWVVKGSTAVTRRYTDKIYGDTAMALKKGEYTKTPIETSSGKYLLYARDIMNISFSEAQKPKKNDGIPYPLIVSLIKDKAKDSLIQKLSAASPLNLSALSSGKTDTVLFTIDGTSMTSGSFSSLCSLYAARSHGSVQTDLPGKTALLNTVYGIALICSDAAKKGFITPEETARIGYITSSFIAREYMMNIVKTKINISDADIQREKTLFLSDKRHSPLSSGLTVDAIRSKLSDKIISSEIIKWREAKLSEYHVSVRESALEGK